MQQSWRRDGDKLTFIVCKAGAEKDVDRPDDGSDINVNTSRDDQSDGNYRDGALDVFGMIGDVNLFVAKVQRDDEEDESEAKHIAANAGDATVGELELMIAVQRERGHGYGKAALLAFLRYILRHEGEILREFFDVAGDEHTATGTSANVTRFDYLAVKIGEENARSIGLFEGLGFTKVKETPSFFGEFELRVGRETVLKMIEGVEFGYREVDYRCPQ
ncbi:hypothetical protein LTR84_000013 [Exophiala bonariae]|uniref:N-acetyltransferase domain-containing protein n=1 Tax=Exophiala bonariae TaxID=1690606 RepID=A0AAV9NQ36_9EURO|nr:hypothetical protein LTR84_000013 [Exophiala bonariae]